VRLEDVEIGFSVSRDEETVELVVKIGTRAIELGARSHHYTLLVLARQRLEDRDEGELPEAEQGWL
jgi:hypothetical protein